MVVFIAPFGSAGYGGLYRDAAFELFRLLTGFLTTLISRGRFVTAVAIVAVALMISGNALSFFALSLDSIQLAHLGTIIGSVIISLVVGRAVLAPGPITAHRVLGAIVLYLNFGMIAAAIYRVIWDLDPAAFGGIAPDATPGQVNGILVYFSFVTLTTTGYGDIFPVNACARGIANLEGIIGQLYPATLLARFVTLELESRRR
jgi:ion channel